MIHTLEKLYRKYRFEYDPKEGILFIRTDKGIKVKELVAIKEIVKGKAKDIRVTSRWQ